MGLKNRIKSSVSKLADTSKEDLSVGEQFAQFATGAFSLQTGEFINDILGDSRNTPHDEMRDGWRMLQNDIQVSQAVSKKNLLIWGESIGVDTDDEATIQYFEDEVIQDFQRAAITAGKHAVALGNGYIEVVRGEQTGVPVGFKEISRPHKIYPQYNADNEIVGYVEESFSETHPDAETFQVMTSERTTRRITGKRYDADEIIHLRIGSSAMPGLGRSDFLSGIDDYKISRELKRFEGVSARYKMIPRKVFTFNEQDESTGIDEPGDTSAGDIRREREQQLNNLDQNENPVYHDVKVDVQDYSYDAQMPQAQDVLNNLSKNLTSPLPEFVSNHSDGNRTPSRHPMNLLQMELAAHRMEWEKEINEVFQEIAKARGLDEGVGIEFGDFNFPTRDEKTTEVMQMFQKNILTLGQAVDRLPFEVEVAEEFEDKYNFELDTGGNPFDQLQQKLDDMENVDKEELQDLVGKDE